MPTRPHAAIRDAMAELAGRSLELYCTYAPARGEAIAFPTWTPRPRVYVRPARCGQARSFLRRPTVEAAEALLILTHEAIHVRGVRDEGETECLALAEVGRFATLLGAPTAMLPQLEKAAWEAHAAAGVPGCRA